MINRDKIMKDYWKDFDVEESEKKKTIVDAYIKNILDYRRIWDEINEFSRKWFNEHEEELLKKHTDENDYLPSILFGSGTLPNSIVDNPNNPENQYIKVCFTVGCGENSRYIEEKVPINEILES